MLHGFAKTNSALDTLDAEAAKTVQYVRRNQLERKQAGLFRPKAVHFSPANPLARPGHGTAVPFGAALVDDLRNPPRRTRTDWTDFFAVPGDLSLAHDRPILRSGILVTTLGMLMVTVWLSALGA